MVLVGHPAGLVGVFGYGGWWAIPVAICIGLVLAAVFPAGAAGCSPRPPRGAGSWSCGARRSRNRGGKGSSHPRRLRWPVAGLDADLLVGSGIGLSPAMGRATTRAGTPGADQAA